MAKEYTEEQIKERIRKLLNQAKSPYPEEAQTALLMAQKLLLKYKIDRNDITEGEAEELEIIEACSEELANTAWAMELARILSKNFGTMLFFRRWRNSKQAVFFGESDKASIARELYDYIVVWLNKRACSYATKMRNTKGIVKGVKQDFIVGFLKGLDEKFKEQTGDDSNQYALVLVISPAVKAAYNNMTFKGKAKQPSMTTHGLAAARNAGYVEGKNFNTAQNGMKRTNPGGELK